MYSVPSSVFVHEGIRTVAGAVAMGGPAAATDWIELISDDDEAGEWLAPRNHPA